MGVNLPRLNSGRLMEIGKTLQNDHEKSHQVRVALNWSIAPDLNRLLQLGRLSPLPGEAMQKLAGFAPDAWALEYPGSYVGQWP